MAGLYHATPAPTKKKRILVYHIGNLGDTIASVPALRAVRRKYGTHGEIYLLHDHSPGELVNASEVLGGCGLVDHFWGYRSSREPRQAALSMLRLWWRIVRFRFHAVIYLMQSERSKNSVLRDKLFFSCCGIRRRLGFESFSREFLYPRDANGMPQAVEHEALRRLNRLRKAGFDVAGESELDAPFLRIPDGETVNALSWLTKNRQYPGRTLVGFCPGSKMTSKVWPAERFVEIGKRLLATQRFEIVIIGGPSELSLANFLVQEWGSGLNTAGSFSVLGSAALLQHCSFALTVDSGPMHLGAAVGTPCVALFSGIDYPGRYSPLGRDHIVLRHPVPCSGCRLQVCPIEGHPCMSGITVEDAWQGIADLLTLIGLSPKSADQSLGEGISRYQTLPLTSH